MTAYVCSTCKKAATTFGSAYGVPVWKHTDGSSLCRLLEHGGARVRAVEEPEADSESTLATLAHTYYKERGINPTGRPRGKKLLEEVGELIEAIALNNRFDIWCEIGDAAIALAYIAEYNDTTVEEAMKIKTLRDKGRG